MPRLAVINPYQKFYALDGITALSGGKVQFYQNLTTTPLSIYSDRNLQTPQTNPYRLDAGGGINGDVFFPALATLVTYDSNDAEVETFNNVSCVDLAVPFTLWSATTVYTADFSSGNIVQSPVDGNYYISILSPNLNHEPSVSPTYWEPYLNFLIKFQNLVAAKSIAVGNATTGLAGVAIAVGAIVAGNSTNGIQATTLTPGYVAIGNATNGLAGVNINAKGSILAGNGTLPVALAAGTDGYALSYDSAQTSGLKAVAFPTSGQVLLATVNPTAAANVDFLTTFSATYNRYLVIGEGITVAVTDALLMRLAVTGSADTGSNYANPPLASSTSSTATSIVMHGGNFFATGKGGNFFCYIENANDATNLKSVMGLMTHQSATTPTWNASSINSVYFAANAITGFRLYWNGGANFGATGAVRVYGLTN